MTDVAEKTLPTELKPVASLAESDMTLAEHAGLRYRVTPKPGVEPESLLRPEYWAHVSKKLPPLTEIRAICQDGSWLADYVVLNSGMNWAKVMLLQKWRLSDSAPTQSIGDYSVEWAGPVHKWRISRSVNGAKDILKHGLPDETSGQAWLREHLKAIR